jgi:hypothetical protein
VIWFGRGFFGLERVHGSGYSIKNGFSQSS